MALPLVALAATLVPEIIRLVSGDRAGALAGTVAEAVREAAGTADPKAAGEALAADPARAGALRLRLAEIALEAGTRRRAAELETLRARLADTEAARASMAGLLRGGSPLAWAPAALSGLVVTGFLAVLVLLVTLDTGTARHDPQIASVINITVGALGAAFAAVVNFWLGSSQSSREKDAAFRSLQGEAARRADTAMEALRGGFRPVSFATPLAANAPDDAEARFGRCVDLVLEKEGGYVNHPRDPGGATNMGITLATLRDFRDAEVGEADVRDLTREEAREIYRARYWLPMRCAELPAGVDLMVFDFGVNAGPGRSLRLLQRAAGVTADGSIGPVTLAALRARPAAALVAALAERRMEHYRSLPTFDAFGRGWTRRTEAMRRAALDMAAEAGAPPRPAAMA